MTCHLHHMSRPISLWRPRASISSDEACTTILKYTLPTSQKPPSYTSATSHPEPLSYVPPLAFFCIRQLVQYPDQLHKVGPTRLRYEPQLRKQDFDIIQALIPDYPDIDIEEIDPRLWATLAQLYSGLPDLLCVYTLGLSDLHLPLLQHIPQTPDFSLLTILELPKCRELSDDSIVELKVLHNLCAFDASSTSLSAWGVKQLTKTLAFAEDEEYISGIMTRPHRGPWGLRILSLKDCINIDDQVSDYLQSFPLLCVIDLRGTRCRPGRVGPFGPTNKQELFHPATMHHALRRLLKMSSELTSHSGPFFLRVQERTYNPIPHSINALPVIRPHEERISSGRTDIFRHNLESLDVCACDGLLEDEGSIEEYFEGCGQESEEEHEYWSNPEPEVVARDTGHMNDIAAVEVERHSRERAALAFYQNPILNSHPRRADRLPRLLHHPDAPEPSPLLERSVHLHTLFRDPPPWSSIPPPAQGRPDDTARRRSLKRPRRSLTEGAVCSEDAARKPAQGRAVETLVGMVQRRAQAPLAASSSHSPAEVEQRVSTNPFARREATRPGEGELRKGLDKVKASTARPVVPPSEARSDTDITLSQETHVHTRRADAVRCSQQRSLRPITTLKVPPLPPGAKTKLSARRRSTGGSGSVKGLKAKQTTLVSSLSGRQSMPAELASTRPTGFRTGSHILPANATTKDRMKPGQSGSSSKSGFGWKRWGQS